MRETFLIVIVIILACLALVRPRIGLYACVWFDLMRPDFFAWSANGTFPYIPVLSITTALGSLRHFQDYSIVLRNPTARCLILLQIPVIASVIFAVRPELAYPPFWEFERLMPIVLLIPVLIRTEEHLCTMFLVIASSLGMVGLKFGIYGLRVGGVHFADGYAGLDNNGLASQLSMAVPILWYSRTLVHAKLARHLFLAMIAASFAAVVMTESRGGSLALLTAILLVTSVARRRVAVVLLFCLLAIPPIYLVQERYFSRMETLKDPTQESSANSRLIMAHAAFDMWKSYPLFGVGFGNQNFMVLQREYVEDSRYWSLKVHNGYLQMLVDCGLFGFVLWVWLLFSVIVRLWRSAVMCRARQLALEAYPRAMAISLIAFAQYNLSGGRERDTILYILVMCAAAWQAVALAEAQQSRSAEAQIVEGEVAAV